MKKEYYFASFETKLKVGNILIGLGGFNPVEALDYIKKEIIKGLPEAQQKDTIYIKSFNKV